MRKKRKQTPEPSGIEPTGKRKLLAKDPSRIGNTRMNTWRYEVIRILIKNPKVEHRTTNLLKTINSRISLQFFKV